MTARSPRVSSSLEAARSGALWLAALVGGTCILLFLAGVLFDVRAQIVTSGSMEPAIRTGSLILVTATPADEIEVGDVTTVGRSTGSGLVTHRVVEIAPADEGVELTLQGDANASPDPSTYVVSSAGVVLVSVPGLGYAAAWLRTPAGIAVILGVALAVNATYLVGGRRDAHDEPEDEQDEQCEQRTRRASRDEPERT